MLASPVRRTVLLVLGGMGGLLLPLGLASPTHAIPGCVSEAPVLGVTCDDEVPPETTSAAVDLTSGTPTVIASADHAAQQGLDTDPIGIQCSLEGGASWAACGPMPGLSEGNYTVLVRAVDTADAVIIDPCDVLDCGTEVPDYEATPTAVQFSVGSGGGDGGLPGGPNGAPETQISGGPHDKITPGAPVALTRTPQFTLASSEPATFNCAVNARKIPCHAGLNVLKRLKPGSQVLVAQAVDREGNYDATPASLTFYVPLNLKPGQGTGWKKVRSGGSFAGDYVSTSTRGAVLTVGSANGVREVRLIAPTGPSLGKVAVRVGHGKWKKVDLKSAKTQKLRVFVIRGPGAGRVSGAIQIQALRVPGGGAVAVDAIVAR